MHCAKAAQMTIVHVNSKQRARPALNDQEAGHYECMLVPLLSGLAGIAMAGIVPSESLLSVRLD
jgi:hypothetical protein